VKIDNMRSLPLLLAVLGILSFSGCDRYRTPYRYEIPNGYKGWVFIFWERPDATELAVEQNHVIIRFPSNGAIKTSSSELDGWATDDYYWILPDGSREHLGTTGSSLINGQGGGTGNPGSNRQVKYSYFYVGDDYLPTMTHDASLKIALEQAGVSTKSQ
jgi:hypothetical protein